MNHGWTGPALATVLLVGGTGWAAPAAAQPVVSPAIKAPRAAPPSLALAERWLAQDRAAEAEAELAARIAAGDLGASDAVRARLLLVDLLLSQDRAAEAEPFVQAAVAATGPDDPQRGWAVGSAVNVLIALDRPAEALPLMEQDLVLSEHYGADGRARALSRLGVVLVMAGRFRDASDRLEDAMAVMDSAGLTDAPLRLATLSHLGRALDLQGRHAEAEPRLESALDLAISSQGETSQATAGALADLGTHFNDTGQYDRADETLRRAVAIYERTTGPRSRQTAASLTNLGNVYMNAGRWAAAEPYYRRALAINVESGTDVDQAIDLTNLGWVIHKQGRHLEAEEMLARSVGLFESTLGLDHPYTATARTNLAGALRIQGRCAEAAPMFREVARAYALSLDDDNPMWPFTLNGLAACLADLDGDPVEIEGLFRRAVDIAWTGLPPGHPYGLEPANDYAHWLIGQGRPDEARALLDRAGGALIDRTAARAASERTAQAELAQFRTLFQLRVDAAWALAQATP